MKESFSMRNRRAEDIAQFNWIAILSFTGSVVVSLAIWMGLFRAIEYFTP